MRVCRIRRPFLDFSQCSFFLNTLSSSPPLPSPVPVQAHHSRARTLVLFPGVHFPHKQRKLPEKQMQPCYLVSCFKPFLVKNDKRITCPLFLACILCSNNTRLLLVAGLEHATLVLYVLFLPLSQCEMPFLRF